MVKVGFIVEGDTEKIIIESPAFVSWAKSQGIEICSPVIDAKGGGNLLPQNIQPMINQLQSRDLNCIFILTDLEDSESPDAVRSRIGSEFVDSRFIFIAVKAIESWFLADTAALRLWLEVEDVYENMPEATEGMPWDRLKALAAELNKRGPGGSKNAFAKRMVKHYGFSIANAAAHPACLSAKEFHDSLVQGGYEW